MADTELVRVLDYILNRCGAAEIEAVAASVVRRKRDLAMFGDAGLMDPNRWAKKAAQDLAGSTGASLHSVRDTVRNLASEMLRKEAPELTEEQVDELLGAWVPDGSETDEDTERTGIVDVDGEVPSDRPSRVPSDVLLSMVDQFVSYSTGHMSKGEEEPLRRAMGSWPQRYWRSFPGGVRAVITEYLKGDGDQAAF
ncbi:MAG: hypothetical protein WCT14_17030, partial [Treponemataceae bacterium]